MLIYHPIKDANHCIYRIISIMLASKVELVNMQILQMIDFFYVFPGQLKNINKWPRANSKQRLMIENINDEFEFIESPKRIFFELKEVHKSAINHLQSKGILEIDNNFVKIARERVPEELISTLEHDDFRKSPVFKLMADEFLKQNPTGTTGVKYKTGLMEYKYD